MSYREALHYHTRICKSATFHKTATFDFLYHAFLIFYSLSPKWLSIQQVEHFNLPSVSLLKELN